MRSSFNKKTFKQKAENIENNNSESILHTHNEKIKTMTSIKYYKDISYSLFDEIFSNMEFENLEGEKVKINDYEDFANFQKNLNSNYNTNIKFFDYNNKINVNILKEIPYKATKLRKMVEEDGALIISPNGHFVRMSEMTEDSVSSLEHYNTVIGNSLILKGVYYYEIKILELGDNTDMCFGIIAKNSDFINNKNYKKFPLCEFEDCYGFNLNNTFIDKYENEIILSVGTVVSLKVDLNKGRIYMYFNGDKIKNNFINIKDKTLGYYPAFSLSSGKEIQVKFGGMYNLYTYFKTPNQVDAKPICQYNNLENIVSCYMKIVENCLIKIINHEQIWLNDSIRFFYPMINFFSKIAFNDEYIMKNYILKFFINNYYENKDIEKFFDEKYTFLYLIILNIEQNKQQKSILFLLDCLCEEIKNDSYIIKINDTIPNTLLNIKLYNYFLRKKLFKEILFLGGIKYDIVCDSIKLQLFYIFQSIKVLDITHLKIDPYNILENVEEIIEKFNNKYCIECFSELIETLLGLKLENKNTQMNKIDELIKKVKTIYKDKENSEGNTIKNKIENTNDFEILEKYLFDESKNNKELSKNENVHQSFFKNGNVENEPYRFIFLDLINDNLKNISGINTYNILSTIYIPLINLYNIYYEMDNSYNYTNENILSFLPILFSEHGYLNDSNSKQVSGELLMINRSIKHPLKDIIDSNILSQELHKKQYNNPSYLIQLLIKLSSFFEEELFKFDYYLQNGEYRKIIKIWRLQKDNFKINNYIGNTQKLNLLFNAHNMNIVKRSLDSLIPYFTQLMNNEFYLFLPFKFINMLKFFIKILVFHFFISNDKEILKCGNTKKLIQLFVDMNFKLLLDKNAIGKFFLNVLVNIKFLHNMFKLIKERSYEIRDRDLEDGNDLSVNESISNFKYYVKDSNLSIIILMIQYKFVKIDKCNKKTLIEFLLYFNPDKFSNPIRREENIFISLIINMIEKEEDKEDFWMKTFVVDSLVKDKLIKKLKKVKNIINKNFEEFDENKENKIKKYFSMIIQILNFISCFIKDKIIIKKYINHYIEDKEILFEEESESEDNNEKEIYAEDKNGIFCYFIHVGLLIIKILLDKNFSLFCQKKINNLNKHKFKMKYLIEQCFKFLVTILVSIPKKYEEILENNKEKNKNKGKKKKNKKKEEEQKEDELNEDLKNYYMQIINNIKVNDIMRLTTLLEINNLVSINIEEHKSQLRKIIKYLNEIETKYNLMPKEIHSKEDSQDANKCPICLDKNNDIHIQPCDHMFCFSCIKKLTDRRCPICRKNIAGIREHPEFRFPDNDEQPQIRRVRIVNNNNVREINMIPRGFRVFLNNQNYFLNNPD